MQGALDKRSEEAAEEKKKHIFRLLTRKSIFGKDVLADVI